jgi:hypothetical protein
MSEMEMPLKKKGQGLAPEALAQARKAYEGGEPMASVARRLDIRRPTLIAARDRDRDRGDPWIVQASVQVSPTDVRAIQERAKSNVINMATRQAMEDAVANGTVSRMKAQIENDLKRHGKLAKMLMDYAEQMLQKGIDGDITPSEKQSAADVFNAVIMGVGRAIEKSRQIGGLQDGDASADSTGEDPVTAIEIRKNIVPKPVARDSAILVTPGLKR